MAPTKFLNDHVSVDKDLADVDRVVPALLVIRHSFIFTGVAILKNDSFSFCFRGVKSPSSYSFFLPLLLKENIRGSFFCC